MPTPLYIVDAFTDQPFHGNPAAVCLLQEPADEDWMQSLSAEMNLSETAFLTPTDQAGVYNLRWFTPKVEVELCGHATLASAHILFTEGFAEANTLLTFATLSGELSATRNADGSIELDFPALDQFAFAPSLELTVAVGIQPIYTGRSSMDLLCELQSEAQVKALSPDFVNLGKIPDIRGVIVTARADGPSSGYDFVSRFFAPSVGIDEDPVTGSAHCVLGPFWSRRLGRSLLMGFQASARGGMVQVEVLEERVKLRGRAVTVVRGQIAV